jgi:cysteinyl-tRNA synthetase
MEDDFNSAGAIGHLQVLATAINRAADDGGSAEAAQAGLVLLELGSILGLFWKKPVAESWPADVLTLAEERVAARKAKNWARSDELRNALADKGVAVEDGPGGQVLKRK